MTSKERVLSVYRDAFQYRSDLNPVSSSHSQWKQERATYHICRYNYPGFVGSGDTYELAWDDAASRLPSAPSPAGETASEMEGMPPCKHCKHPAESHDDEFGNCCELPNPYGIAHQMDGCDCPGYEEGEAVPEPVSTEGAAERESVPPVFNKDRQIVEEVSKLPFSRRLAIYRNIQKTVVAAPIAPAAVSDNECGVHCEHELENVLIIRCKYCLGLLEDIQAKRVSAPQPAAVQRRDWSQPHLQALNYLNNCVLDEVEVSTARLREILDVPTAKPSAEGNGWIAVTERLPPRGDAVIVAHYHVKGTGALTRDLPEWSTWFASHNGERWMRVDGFNRSYEGYPAPFNGDVRYWQPMPGIAALPAPPSGQGEME